MNYVSEYIVVLEFRDVVLLDIMRDGKYIVFLLLVFFKFNI